MFTKRPMALNIIRRNINAGKYPKFEAFARDCSLVIYNARSYNVSKSQIALDAVKLDKVLLAKFKDLKRSGLIEDATLPHIGGHSTFRTQL